MLLISILIFKFVSSMSSQVRPFLTVMIAMTNCQFEHCSLLSLSPISW